MTFFKYPDTYLVMYRPTGLKVLSTILIVIAFCMFVYFFNVKNLHFTGTVGSVCFLLAFCGGLIWWIPAFLGVTEKTKELNFESVKHQVRQFMICGMATLWASGLFFYFGLFTIFYYHGNLKALIPFFSISIILFVGGLYFFIQRRIVKDHYELKKHQQEILEEFRLLKSQS